MAANRPRSSNSGGLSRPETRRAYVEHRVRSRQLIKWTRQRRSKGRRRSRASRADLRGARKATRRPGARRLSSRRDASPSRPDIERTAALKAEAGPRRDSETYQAPAPVRVNAIIGIRKTEAGAKKSPRNSPSAACTQFSRCQGIISATRSCAISPRRIGPDFRGREYPDRAAREGDVSRLRAIKAIEQPAVTSAAAAAAKAGGASFTMSAGIVQRRRRPDV